MLKYGILYIVSIIGAILGPALASKGSVELDELSFNKIINKFQTVLVKFDAAFPYGDNHEAFVALAKDAADTDDFLVAEVGIKDYGERDNEKLARMHGAYKDTLPVVKLFVKGKEPVKFERDEKFTSDQLRRFVRENSDVYLSMPGCVKKLDQLALKFMSSQAVNDRNEILKETEALVKGFKGKNAASGKVYKGIMAKIIEHGDEFVQMEIDRIKKVLNGKLSDEKKKELGIKINILLTFHRHTKFKIVQDEL